MTNKPQTEEALKGCPFCGGGNIHMKKGTNRHSCIVVCKDCHCNLESNETWNSGQAWNTRTPDPRLKHYEELVGFVEECAGDIRIVGDWEAECEPTELATKARELLKQIEDNND